MWKDKLEGVLEKAYEAGYNDGLKDAALKGSKNHEAEN